MLLFYKIEIEIIFNYNLEIILFNILYLENEDKITITWP